MREVDTPSWVVYNYSTVIDTRGVTTACNARLQTTRISYLAQIIQTNSLTNKRLGQFWLPSHSVNRVIWLLVFAVG